MFTNSCHINKNTKYLRDELEKLGRVCISNGFAEWYIPIEDCKYLYCSDEPFDGNRIYYYTGKMVKPTNSIYCDTNEELFLAIAALRDDSDKHQWFTNDVFWIKCSQLELKHELDNNYEEFCVADFHKATVSELIEHFKK